MNKRISPLSPLEISSPPPFQPESFDDPAKAVETLMALYERNTAFLIKSFAELAQGAPISSRYRAFYPQVSIETTSFGHVDSRLSYGHVTAPGIYTTTVTRPKLFKHYLKEQLALLMKSHNVPVIVSESTTPIPLHFAFGEGAHVEASTTAFVDIPMRDIFDTPDLNTTDDEIANGEYIPPPGEPSPLAPFTAQRIDYSLARLSHYTATHAEHFQNFVLFTNYQFYIDEFCSWARKMMAEDGDGYTAFVEPGNVVTLPGSKAPETDAALTRLPQMPAYHLKKKGHAGITMINIGVGPSNAKTITDHVAVLRPHAWLMLGHCAGLRNSQRLGDYVLAHAYMREDHVLDDDLPVWVPIPALAEVQVALEAAVAEITGYEGFELKRIMRTGTVGTIDNRNWELRDQRGPVKRLSQARAIALDMESATIAANGFRFRVPYGTLLCVSDKPLHGELKLPGMATAFYRTQVNQHLQIGIRAVQKLAAMPKEALHSRKLRSFFETAFQ
ncbi:AMP nucleosidase [Rhizobium leguminosarum]|jgi:AMP nucleosidase|uniref:AMP nucleosidase n=3 Tax=Rhizobium TaxID=379 RepID=A0A7G6RIN5_RHILV|nr:MULTISPECIES: AMP nucleosidase [Rhizobium]MBA8834524.1 AMP nucleosidase [Rhizobium leguminosarum]MBY5900574.1 AMP nucleosidase [Rhizobium leguminosarum]MBY5906776.1 AMP nucleosidase [Rhizobium leguminosarum]MBY5913220.1 AMP nucleosidase [Rhizobium leguminosarum]MCJ9697067.1 AMP nucleosidase [Rhizobium sp. PRIMUS64]